MNEHRAELRAIKGLMVSALLAAGPAVAQDIDLAELRELDDDRTDITYEGMSVHDLEELDIVREGQRIGEVEDVLARNDEVVALVVDLEGNLPGLGDRDVVVPIGEIELVEGRRQAELSLTDEELAKLPDWND
ncbi:MAG: PRC-barrel domain-containing protein [Gammaproteobacteria bacterium]